MAIDDEELEKNVEMMSLLPDRYYVILRSTGKDEFTMSAYDTTNKTYDDDDDFNSAMIVQEGVLDMVREHTDDLFDRGVAAIQFRLIAEEMIEETEIEDPRITKTVEGNVVRVNFGTEQ